MGGTRVVALLPEDNIAYKSFHVHLVLGLPGRASNQRLGQEMGGKIGACRPIQTIPAGHACVPSAI